MTKILNHRCGFCHGHEGEQLNVHAFPGVNQWIFSCDACIEPTQREVASLVSDPNIEWWGMSESGLEATIQAPTFGDTLFTMPPEA